MAVNRSSMGRGWGHFLRGLPALCVVSFSSLAVGADTGADTTEVEKRPFFPIWSQWAVDRGFDLPKPFGIGVVYANYSQDVNLEDVVIEVDDEGRAPIEFVDLGNSTSEGSSLQLRADLWVLPFLNLFAFTGEVDSQLEGEGTIQGDDVLAYLGLEDSCSASRPPELCGQTILGELNRDSQGTNTGFGGVLAGGRDPWFGLLGFLYTQSDLEDVDTEIDTLSLSPRVGRVWRLQGGGKLSTYVGAYYTESEVRLSGVTPIVVGSQTLELNYTVTEETADPWSGVVGAAWEITPHWTFLGDVILGGQETAIASLTFRF